MQQVQDFLKQENIKISLSEMWVNPERQRLSSLCYLENQGEVLLLKRNKEPFRGFWTAPGGKLVSGENPRQTVIREIREETGLTLDNSRLQIITSETGFDRSYNWLVFIFRADKYSGILKDSNEGILSWIPLQQIMNLKIPDVDRRLLPLIMDDQQRYYIRLSYSAQHQVASMQKFTL